MALSAAVIDTFLGLRTDTPPSKCPDGYSPDMADMDFSVGGIATRFPFRVELTMPAEIVYDKSFQGRDGNTYRLVVDVNGAMWSVAADGTRTQIDSVYPGSQVTSVTAYGREYLAFFNAQGGSDAPRQWDGRNLYRVSQGGPGAAPVFTASAISTDKYPVSAITQPYAQSRGYSYFLQSSGPGLLPAGTTVTIYYSDSTLGGSDTDLVAAFNSGFPCYVYASFTGGPATQGPYTVLVTSVGEAQPPGQPRSFYYFTFEVPTTAGIYYQGSGHVGYTANYQRTVTTVYTSVPIPGVSVGDNLTITGSSVSAWNATWPVTQTPLSATMSITQTSLTAGVATYNYAVTSGVPPTAGQAITITGTLNAGAILNVANVPIVTASGGALGSFTIGGFAGSDFAAAAESGVGITAGTAFTIEPGNAVAGTSTSPVYGNATGGFIVFAGTAATITSGTRQAVQFFITENDTTTAAGPIISFTIPANTNAIVATGLAIGPPNIKARGVAFTPANGSRFFYMAIPATVNGVVIGTSTVVSDNTSDSATFEFSDAALQVGLGIDIPGNNIFQQVTLDTPSGVEWYGDRMFWWGGKNKVTSLINMEMDGGTGFGSNSPLGWTIAGSSGAVQQVGSAPAYVVSGPGTGEITQAAAYKPNGTPIVQPNQDYALRLWTNGGGIAVGTLSSASTGFTSTATIPLTLGYVAADFMLKTPAIIPNDMILDFKITGLALGTSSAVRDLQLIYADNPNRNPKARASYVQNPDAYDQLTGNVGPNDDSTELRAMFVLQESLHFLTAKALYYVWQIGNSEPGSWNPRQVSDQCGAFHANAVTTGQGWAAWAGPLGFFRYSGGVPEKLSNIIAPTWRALLGVTNVLDDPKMQRVYIGLVRGARSLMTLDYHELQQGGTAKWCEWRRPVNWISASGFAVGSKVYSLDTIAGTDDDDLGPIGGYITFPPFAPTMFLKDFSSLGLRVTGAGVLTPFFYAKNLDTLTRTLRAQELSTLLDVVAEWSEMVRGRMLFLKLGQPGAQFTLEEIACAYQIDQNAPIAGVR